MNQQEQESLPVSAKSAKKPARKKSQIRDNLYSRIHVSLQTMDKIIIGTIILLAIALTAGILMGR